MWTIVYDDMNCMWYKCTFKELPHHSRSAQASTPNIHYIDGLMQDCSYSSALTIELLQFCTKLSTYSFSYTGTSPDLPVYPTQLPCGLSTTDHDESIHHSVNRKPLFASWLHDSCYTLHVTMYFPSLNYYKKILKVPLTSWFVINKMLYSAHRCNKTPEGGIKATRKWYCTSQILYHNFPSIKSHIHLCLSRLNSGNSQFVK